MRDRSEDLTTILRQFGDDDPDGAAMALALPLVYDELRGLAGGYLRGERTDHTLQATALVHEAYVRLAGSNGQSWENRKHFFRLAAKVMRHILVDHARARAAGKRGGGATPEPLSDTALIFDGQTTEILEIDDALGQLFLHSPERAQVVELRFYGGCTIEETAEVMGISSASVERHWRFSRAWLKAKLGDEQPKGE